MTGILMLAQTPTWHHRGLYMGMHWGWWVFWILLLLVVAWAFWRVVADRSESRREAENALRAEEALRERFARGEIGEDEFARSLRVLQESRRLV